MLLDATAKIARLEAENARLKDPRQSRSYHVTTLLKRAEKAERKRDEAQNELDRLSGGAGKTLLNQLRATEHDLALSRTATQNAEEGEQRTHRKLLEAQTLQRMDEWARHDGPYGCSHFTQYNTKGEQIGEFDTLAELASALAVRTDEKPERTDGDEETAS